MIYIGIDPGVLGGIAVLSATGVVEQLARMPVTERDILDVIGEAGHVRARAVLERAQASPQMGVVSAFTFGRGYGALRMALTAARVPFDEVQPRKWQQAMGCLSGGDKNITKRRAQQLFPNVKVTHFIADALLMAEFCRRVDNAKAAPMVPPTKSVARALFVEEEETS